MPYAESTKVPVNQTRSEIEKMLRKVKAERVITMDEPLEAIVMFLLNGRLIKIRVELIPDKDQERRSRWRALGLVIKAKLEGIASKISTIEQEFLPYVVLPDGQTVSEWIEPQLQVAYDQGTMPSTPFLLPPPKG